MSTYSYMKKGHIQTTTILKQMEVISLNDLTEFFIDNDDENIELEKLVQKLDIGDTIILCSLAVIELTQRKLSELLQVLHSRSIRLISVQESLDTQNADYKNFYSNSLICLNWEKTVSRNIVKKRLLLASENGVELGRPCIPAELVERIRYLRNVEKKSIRYIAERCDVSIGTVHKYVKNQ